MRHHSPPRPERRWACRCAAAVALLLASPAVGQMPEPAPAPPPATDPATGAKPPPKEVVGSAADPVRASSDEGETWADDSHRDLEEGLNDLTERFDLLFGEYRRLDLEQPGTYLRWRSELRLDSRGSWTPRMSVRASVRLPALGRWLEGLQLVFAGESQGDATSRRLDDPGNPGFSPTIQARQASLEARIDLLRRRTTVIQAAVGVRMRLPFEYYGALRFFQRLDLGWKVTARFTQEGIWTNRELFGEKTQLDLDRPVGPDTQVRWNNAGFITGVSRGYEWGTELGVANQFRWQRLGSYLAFGVSGYGVPRPRVELYRLYDRFRRDLWRRWLFVELEPQVGWLLIPEVGRRTVFALTVRLDVVVDGRARPARRGEAARPVKPAPGPG